MYSGVCSAVALTSMMQAESERPLLERPAVITGSKSLTINNEVKVQKNI